MFYEELLNNYQTYLLIFARIVGVFIYNPILSRKNVPTRVKIGISIALAGVIGMPLVGTAQVEIDSTFLLAVAFIKEGAVGLILGFITQMFYSTLLLSGQSMDMISGLGMAKIYDSASGVQMSAFGTIMTYMFVLYFFITDCHLSYIKIMALSYDFVPIGFNSFSPELLKSIVLFFGTVLTMAMKLAMPIIAAQLILEFCVGILMKAVPQIQVMQVNIQLKLLFSLFLVFFISTPLCEMIEKYMNKMIDTLVSVLPSISA